MNGWKAAWMNRWMQELWVYMRRSHRISGAAQAPTPAPLTKWDVPSSPRKRPLEPEPPQPIQYFSLLEFLLHDRFESWPGVRRACKHFTLAMQAVALGGTAVSEVIQVGSSMYMATRFHSPQFWAVLCGTCFMTPLTYLPNYKTLECFAMAAVVAVIFTAACVVGLAVEYGVYTERIEPAGAPAWSVSSFFVGNSGFVFIWGGLALVPEVQSSMEVCHARIHARLCVRARARECE